MMELEKSALPVLQAKDRRKSRGGNIKSWTISHSVLSQQRMRFNSDIMAFAMLLSQKLLFSCVSHRLVQFFLSDDHISWYIKKQVKSNISNIRLNTHSFIIFGSCMWKCDTKNNPFKKNGLFWKRHKEVGALYYACFSVAM